MNARLLPQNHHITINNNTSIRFHHPLPHQTMQQSPPHDDDFGITLRNHPTENENVKNFVSGRHQNHIDRRHTETNMIHTTNHLQVKVIVVAGDTQIIMMMMNTIAINNSSLPLIE
jgi:hypothetical protein